MTKKILSFALSLALVLSGGFFTVTPAQAQQPVKQGSFYYSTGYNQWVATVFTGFTGTGSQTMSMLYGYVTLPDGRPFVPFATNVPLIVDTGSNAETVTPSAVSGCYPLNPNQGVCQVTATFSNAHGNGAIVVSGDQGIQEAINDAGANGGGVVYWSIDPGIVTLSTGAANTNLGSVKIPTRSVVLSASALVTTTIATCAGGWSLGWSTGTEFTAANTTLTAGTNTDSSTITLPAVVAAATIPVNKCTTSNASAGAIHPKFVGYKVVAPTS